MPAAIRRAAAVLVPSESTRRDVAVVTGVDPARIHVTQAGVAARYRLVTDAAELGRVRRTYNLPDDFLLAVGTIEPRKNLERLIDAFTLVRARGVHEPLVVVGQLGWKYTRLLDRVRAPDAQGAVRLIGYVADDDMPALYTLARGLVFPSLYEGFGLPILEAMACGTPVLTSNRSAMSEVAGSAAMLVDPHDVATMADAIQTLARDEPHREALREAGLARAAEFPWSRAAEATVRIYDRIAPSATASS
jgi:glycosyltransferase involved in cell wall biosynthesis